MIWQLNWASWGLHWSKEKEEYYSLDMERRMNPVYSNYIIFGPFQMHWWSS